MDMTEEEGISSRPMRLKVLYTFDAENKNNCLARSPHILDIKTAFIDDTTQIGIVDLKTCIQIITTASPELVSKLDLDYTVYAYDYSETDIPLVGQGLLSGALLSDGQDPDSDSAKLVTGRVTQGVLGLFTRNAQETLEVKLRLTPVPSSTHNDYLNSLQKYREASGAIGQDFDAQAWTNFVQNNPGFVSGTNQMQSIDRSASPMDRTGLGAMHRMLSEGGTPRDTSAGITDPFTTRPSSRPPSRHATPTLGQPFNAPPRQQGGPASRPSSRGGMQPVAHQRRDSFNSGYYSAEENFEEGPAKKRAKVTQVQFPSKSNLNIERQSDSLRVAASTASSVRLHRPIAVKPTLALHNGTFAEEPVRPPTPISRAANPAKRRQRNDASSLRRQSQVQSSSPAPPIGRQQSHIAEARVSSPEDTRQTSIANSPADIPSSPPIMPDARSSPPSPALPPLPGEHDSGFMSGVFDDDFFNDTNLLQFDEYMPEKSGSKLVTDIDVISNGSTRFAPVFEDGNETEKSTSANLFLQPIATAKPTPPSRTIHRSYTSGPASRMDTSSRQGPESNPGAQQQHDGLKELPQFPQFPALPQIPQFSHVTASDPLTRPLHRSNTWAGDMSDTSMPASDAPTGEDSRPRSRKRVGKEQTKARLETAIASGEMPPFCDNCGAIETPAWRRAFAKTFSCGFDEVETSLEDGAIVFKEILEHNENGSMKNFRGFKITKRSEDKDDEWQTVTLCNPCGLWFHKQKCMRPEEKWNKGPKDPKDKRKRRSRPRSERTAARKTNNGSNTRSDAGTPPSDASTPQGTVTEAAQPDEMDNDDREGNIGGRHGAADEPELPSMPRRAASAEPTTQNGLIGLRGGYSSKPGQRISQSSPVRPHGSEAEPIEIDLTPKPIRRQLFSPGNQGSAKSSKSFATSASGESSRPLASLPNFVRRSPRLNRTKETFDLAGLQEESFDTIDKENVTPGRSLDDLDDLFNDAEDDTPRPPMTPTPTRRSDRHIFKTPSKTPIRTAGATLSPNVQRSIQKSTRHPVAAALLGSNKTVAEMTPFTKQIHQLLSDAVTFQARSSPQSPPVDYARRSPRKSSPKNVADFDFPDLPSLSNSSPASQNRHINLDFSELTTEQMQQTDYRDVPSTDTIMPSSPPPGFFNFADTHDDGINGLWSEMDFGNEHVFMGVPRYVDPTTMSPGLRRSPRNRVDEE